MIYPLIFILGFSASAIAQTVNTGIIYNVFARNIMKSEDSNLSFPIGEINVSEKLYLKSNEDLILDDRDWCFELKQNGDIIFPCFQFHKGSLEVFKNGEFSIELTDDNEIENISFNTNTNLNDVKLKFVSNTKIQSPSLKYKSNKQTPNQNQDQNDSNMIMKKKGSLKGPLGTELKQDVNSNDFNEIIIPESGGKTFFERNWKFIVPPVLIVIVMSYFAEPLEASGSLENSEEKHE